eukprot:TRINITY_DN8205_c0_g2_i1.p1 TRINITY_DN8205_c0_g2~~TRINITY_DN8205_c0_g2_i1.p1  ORF type:complete len:677 (+),score=313.93 TRINITY_DN8205_c0_g2_i1:71-2101(+)
MCTNADGGMEVQKVSELAAKGPVTVEEVMMRCGVPREGAQDVLAKVSHQRKVTYAATADPAKGLKISIRVGKDVAPGATLAAVAPAGQVEASLPMHTAALAAGAAAIACRLREAPARLVYHENGSIVYPKKDPTKDIRHQAMERERQRLKEEEEERLRKEAAEAAERAAAGDVPMDAAPTPAEPRGVMDMLQGPSSSSLSQSQASADKARNTSAKKPAREKKGTPSLMSMWGKKPAAAPAPASTPPPAPTPEPTPASESEPASAPADAAPAPAPTPEPEPAAELQVKVKVKAAKKPAAKKEAKEKAKVKVAKKPAAKKAAAAAAPTEADPRDQQSESSDEEMNDDEKRYLSDMTIAAALGTPPPEPPSQPAAEAAPEPEQEPVPEPEPEAVTTASPAKRKREASPEGQSEVDEAESTAKRAKVATGSPKKAKKKKEPATAFDLMRQAPQAAPKKHAAVKGKAKAAAGKGGIEAFAMRGVNEFKNRYEKIMQTNESFDADGAMVEEDVWMFKEKATGKLLTEAEYRGVEQAELKRQGAERAVLEKARKAEAAKKAKELKAKQKEEAKAAKKKKQVDDDDDDSSIATSDIATEDLSSDEDESSEAEEESEGESEESAPAPPKKASPKKKKASPKKKKASPKKDEKKRKAPEPKQAPPAKKPKAKAQSNNLLNYFAKKK